MKLIPSKHHFSCRRRCLFHPLYFSFLWQVVSEDEYRSWLVNRKSAQAAIEQKEQLIMDTAVQMETNLTLLGNTHHTLIIHTS